MAARDVIRSLTNLKKMNPLLQSRVARWIDDQVARQKLPFGEIIVRHRGKVVCEYSNRGQLDAHLHSLKEPIIYRIFSMTKPIVSLAVMLLHEEGRFLLSEPAWKYLGEKWHKKNMKVLDVKESEKQQKLVTVPCKRSITIHHLLTHTSGLSHGLSVPGMNDPLDALYSKVGLGANKTLLSKDPKPNFDSLHNFCDRLAECPLLFQPGDHWNYSYSVDLLGRIVEVVSGQALEDFLQERIFRKLGMTDTSFTLSAEKATRLAGMWLPGRNGAIKRSDAQYSYPGYSSGSAGLFGTMPDYLLFAEMLLRGGVSRTGEQVVSKRTLEWMTMNQLRGRDGTKKLVREMGFGHLADDQPKGAGFGLGFGVIEDVPYEGTIVSKGEFYWAGAASTYFWVDPSEDLLVVFGTQLLMPDPREVPINPPLHSVIYGGLSYDGQQSRL